MIETGAYGERMVFTPCRATHLCGAGSGRSELAVTRLSELYLIIPFKDWPTQ
jgi:hypothetical protein